MDNRDVFEQELIKTGRNGIDQLIAELAKTDFTRVAAGAMTIIRVAL